MSERKQLSVKRKAKTDASAAQDDENGTTGILGGKKKRIVIAQPEPVQKVVQAKTKRKKKKAPSTLRVNALDAEMGKLSKVWRSHSPLALGIEKQIFQAIGEGHLSASKRVVRALLHKHCHNKNYLVDVLQGAKRFNLDGSESGVCTIACEEHSRQMLKQLDIQKVVKKGMRAEK